MLARPRHLGRGPIINVALATGITKPRRSVETSQRRDSGCLHYLDAAICYLETLCSKMENENYVLCDSEKQSFCAAVQDLIFLYEGKKFVWSAAV